MSSKVQEAVQQVRESVEKLGEPDRMTGDEYAEFLEEVIADLEAYLAAHREESAS